MENFLSRLAYHPNKYIKGHIHDIDMGDKDMPKDVDDFVYMLKKKIENTPEESGKESGKGDSSQGSVHTTNNTAGVNSAHGTLTKNFNNKFKNKDNSAKSEKTEFVRFPKSEIKFKEFAE